MKDDIIAKAATYVEQNIGEFHARRLAGLESLNLQKILKRKNPYLFRVKNMTTADAIVKAFLDAHLSSQEETIFGNWLENLCIFVNGEIYGGKKSGIDGIDLEFDKENIRYIVSIKSGPNWGNSQQVKKMRETFKTAQKTLRTSNASFNIRAVNGCCYGCDNQPDKGDYFKYCGQRFWEFISGDSDLFVEIIEPLGKQAKQHNEKFAESYANITNRFIGSFVKDYCTAEGQIDWKKLVEFNSAV